MSENTTITTQAPANLHETKRAQAQARKAPATKKAPAKATPEKAAKQAAEKPAEKEGKTYIATATGRGGKTNTRKVPVAAKFAVDVADPDGRTPAAKQGLIYRFYADEKSANEFATKKRDEGYDAIVVPATSKEA